MDFFKRIKALKIIRILEMYHLLLQVKLVVFLPAEVLSILFLLLSFIHIHSD